MQYATDETRQRVRANLVKYGVRLRDQPTKAYAYANHGRWVAGCPGCNGAELVIPGEDLVCGSCGEVRQVVWPSDIEEIETVLELRLMMNQNWFPEETVTDLIEENLERGVS